MASSISTQRMVLFLFHSSRYVYLSSVCFIIFLYSTGLERYVRVRVIWDCLYDLRLVHSRICFVMQLAPYGYFLSAGRDSQYDAVSPSRENYRLNGNTTEMEVSLARTQAVDDFPIKTEQN
jgi:hypothetical protein